MNKFLVLLIALVATGAIFFLSTSGLDTSSDPDDLDGGSQDDPSLLEGDDASGEAKRSKSGPVLVSRGRQRAGVGSLRGQLKWFQTGEPGANLEVSVKGTGHGGEDISLVVQTDAEGSFSVPVIAASMGLTVRAAPKSDAPRTLSHIAVEAGGVNDLGVIWLGKGGVLRGRVVDAAGDPIAGADVGVHRTMGSMLEAMSQITDLFKTLDQRPEPEFATKTARDGTFEIEGVPPGDISMVAEASSYETKTHNETMTSTGTIDPVVIALAAGTPVTGVVVDTEGSGIGGARVVLIQSSGFGTGMLARSIAETDGRGHFEMMAPPGGLERLGAFVVAETYPSSIFELNKGKAKEPQRFVLHGGATLGLRVVSQDGDVPLADAELLVFIGSEKKLKRQPQHLLSVVTDDDGRAQFDARPGFIQMVWVKHESVGSQMYMPQMPGPMSAVSIDNPEISEGANDRTIKVKIGTRVSGVVKSEAGTPIAGARVRSVSGFGVGSDVLTDEAGRYECFTSGSMMMMGGLIASAPGWVQDTSKNPSGRNALKPASPGEDVEHDIVMKRAVSITGRVVDTQGNAVAGARVHLKASGRNMVARMFTSKVQSVTGRDGRYRLDGVNPTDGKVSLVVRRKGYVELTSDELPIEAEGLSKVPNVVLIRGLSVIVQVVDPRGNVMVGAEVEVKADGKQPGFDLMDAMGGGDKKNKTNAAGRLTVPGFAPGKITVTAKAKGFAPGHATHTLAEGAEEVRVELRVSVPIRGTVMDQYDNPVPDASVQVSREKTDDGTWMPSVRVSADKEGKFTLEGVPDAPVDIHVDLDGYSSTMVAVHEHNRDRVAVTLTKYDPAVKAKLDKLHAKQSKLYTEMFESDEAGKAKIQEQLSALREEERALRDSQK